MSEIDEIIKNCKTCEQDKSIHDFHKDRHSSDGLSRRCKECKRKSWPAYYKKHREKLLLRAEERQKRLKARVIEHYSNGTDLCICCDENIVEFLTIDHIDNDGGEHRQKLNGGNRGGSWFYVWLIKNNFPEGFQVLCMNCNWGKRNSGTCPHKNYGKYRRDN